MAYMLLIHVDEAEMRDTPPSEAERRTAAYLAYAEELRRAGALLGGERLRPAATGRTVRTAGSRSRITDGPFAEAKEQLGGFFMIDVPDVDAALAWAARCPGAAHGAVEVREVWAHV